MSAGASLTAEDARARLADALSRYSGWEARLALDDSFQALGMDATLSDVVLPYLADIGDCWAEGELSIAREHFASRLIQGHLLGLSHGWEAGDGPLVATACPPGEQHDIGLIAFGMVMHARGWRVVYLGADTPTVSLHEVAWDAEVDLVVMAATVSYRFASVRQEIRRLAEECPVALGGAGADATMAGELGATYLPGDPVGAGDLVAGSPNTGV